MELGRVVHPSTSYHILDLRDICGVAECVKVRELIEKQCGAHLELCVVRCFRVIEVAATVGFGSGVCVLSLKSLVEGRKFFLRLLILVQWFIAWGWCGEGSRRDDGGWLR